MREQCGAAFVEARICGEKCADAICRGGDFLHDGLQLFDGHTRLVHDVFAFGQLGAEVEQFHAQRIGGRELGDETFKSFDEAERLIGLRSKMFVHRVGG